MVGEKVKALDMSPEDDCMKEMFVQIECRGRETGVSLKQLKPIHKECFSGYVRITN